MLTNTRSTGSQGLMPLMAAEAQEMAVLVLEDDDTEITEEANALDAIRAEIDEALSWSVRVQDDCPFADNEEQHQEPDEYDSGQCQAQPGAYHAVPGCALIRNTALDYSTLYSDHQNSKGVRSADTDDSTTSTISTTAICNTTHTVDHPTLCCDHQDSTSNDRITSTTGKMLPSPPSSCPQR